VTIKEAQADLAAIIRRATAGEEIVIVVKAGESGVKIVPVVVAPKSSRLTRHPDLIGSTRTNDPEGIIHPHEENSVGKTPPKLSHGYNPTSLEARERRHLLIEKINAAQSEKSDQALEAVARVYKIGSLKF
jgi:antitoxin (DNA-binding transcriptional repressor) of toxin-antitoxin stability system